MKKKYYIVGIILIVLLAILNLNIMLESNDNKGEVENAIVKNVVQIKEDNGTNNLLVESVQEENIVSKNMEIPNPKILNEKDTMTSKIEKEKKQVTKSKTNTKENKAVKQEKEKQNKASSSSSASNNSQGSGTQWKTQTHYGGEIPDSSGYNGGYWMQGEQLDLSGIDMSDWSIK